MSSVVRPGGLDPSVYTREACRKASTYHIRDHYNHTLRAVAQLSRTCVCLCLVVASVLDANGDIKLVVRDVPFFSKDDMKVRRCGTMVSSRGM